MITICLCSNINCYLKTHYEILSLNPFMPCNFIYTYFLWFGLLFVVEADKVENLWREGMANFMSKRF